MAISNNSQSILSEQIILEERPNWTAEEISKIKKAISFATVKHSGQTRFDGTPYVNHVIHTGKNLAHLGMDTTTIIAGILHDVIEDTETTEEEVEHEFGSDVKFLVSGVSKLSKLRYQGIERHVESLRKFFVASASDIRVVIIKLADRLHNIQTLENVRPEKRIRIAKETLELHARLADRLGMGQLKAELEDLAFPFAYPEEYQKIKELSDEQTKNSQKNIDDVLKNIKDSLALENVNVIRIDSRIKHLYSLFLKLRRYGFDISKIHDIIALRVIVPDVAACYKALGVIHAEYKPLPGRMKDYIAVPKLNGYKSLHTTILTRDGNTAEIQIRTQEMHEEAEFGIASHLHYKEVGKNKSQKEIQKKTSWTKDLLELQKQIEDKDEFLHTLKTDFFQTRVFVFTPKGDVIDLPEGSTPIDFAYAVHSKIGDKMKEAKVNGKLVSFDTPLKRGDVIEIVTGKNSRPSEKWLEHVKTNMAKKQILKYLENLNQKK
jgi:GTP pyrophosphokinase